MIKAVLKACLTAKQREAGLYLEEPDDHTLELKDKNGKVLAVWGSSGATVIEIRKEADKYIKGEDCIGFDIDKALDEISTPIGDITSQVITNNHNEKIEASYDGEQFCIVKDTNYSPFHLKMKNLIELNILEAQRLASFIQDCILER